MYPTHYFESLPSTNIKAKELAENGAVHGSVVFASNQTMGRGRLGKSWYCSAGKGLLCSLIVRPDIPAGDFPKITMVAGLAVALAVDRLAGVFCRLKWPNDIFLDGKKCGGILTESSDLSRKTSEKYAIIGVGLNLNSAAEDFPRELSGTATSLMLQTGLSFQLENVLRTVRDEILRQLKRFEADGFQTILADWKERDFLLGKPMRCVCIEGNIIEGVSLGPDCDGQLHVREASGQIHTVLSGDIRLSENKDR